MINHETETCVPHLQTARGTWALGANPFTSKPYFFRFPNLWERIPHRRERRKPNLSVLRSTYRVVKPRVLIPVRASPLAILEPHFSKRLEATCKKGGAFLPYDTPRFHVVYLVVFWELHAEPEVAQGGQGGEGFEIFLLCAMQYENNVSRVSILFR